MIRCTYINKNYMNNKTNIGTVICILILFVNFINILENKLVDYEHTVYKYIYCIVTIHFLEKRMAA